MLGWINDCIEKLVLDKFGVDAWHTVKQKAKCEVKDGGFFKLELYSDKSTLDLVAAASEVSGLSVDEVLEAFGAFFVHYIRKEGYDNLLCCQGRTLKDWMTNINAIHTHLQTTFPKKMVMPEFWCEDGKTDDGSEDGSLLLHYYSSRGSILVPLAKGLVEEIAKFQFEVEIDMELIGTQGLQDAKFTSWRVSAKNPEEQWKLKQKEGVRDGKVNAPTSFKCPFTGLTAQMPSQPNDPSLGSLGSECPTQKILQQYNEEKEIPQDAEKQVSVRGLAWDASTTTGASTCASTFSSDGSSKMNAGRSPGVGLSGAVTKALFPYHAIMDQNFTILQVGNDLPGVLKTPEESIVGEDIFDMFEITKPRGAGWNWDWLRKLEEQSFGVEPVNDDCGVLRFKASAVLISDSPAQAMLVLTPDANSLDELRDMDLTISDLPVHGAHRDAVFLREHLSTQMNNALHMERLTKSLEREKSLFESLIPEHAAEGLRAGETVEPMMHYHVSMLFSDIVGFTNLCKQIYPWDVIGMLNRLYCVMDFLAAKFNIFKVETIGDCYVACSGLPLADEHHAENVANFAVAVSHCCQQVLSPLDNSPIKLRIGIHTGECASGIVGTTNPRYCVFGDTVNTTARHESTSAPGKIHCSQVTAQELQKQASGNFSIEKRGLVEMKGKGKQVTYWLHGKENNSLVNEAALQQLDVEVKHLLKDTNFGESRNKERAKRIYRKQVEAEAALTHQSPEYFI